MTERQSDAGSPAIDLRVLQDLARDAGPEAMPVLIASFVRDCAKREAEIVAAIKSKDLEALEAQSHALTSSARTFGAPVLADLTRAIEDACRNGWGDDALSRAEILPEVVTAVRQAMTEVSNRFRAADPDE